MTELEVNGVLLSDAEDSVVVNLGSVTDVDVNGTDVWSRVAVLPDKPTNFTASNNLETHILFEWTIGENTIGCDIYMLPDTLVQANALTGYQWYDAPTELHDYVVVARSNEGAVASDSDEGMLLIQGDVTVDYAGVSDGDASTITGSNGSFVFAPPAGITEVNVCMCGGGGAGGYVDINPQYCSGGGFAGDIASEDVPVSFGTDITIVIGVGGLGTASTSDDNAGTQSSFGAIVALGGPSGYDSVTPCQGYDGQGASRDTCGGTFYDGNGTHNGGQAGAFGDGGDGFVGQDTNGGDGGIGAGGGSVTQGSTNRSGNGGNGRVVISWSI